MAVRVIRPETATDHAAVAALHRAAFERPNEAALVERLRRHAAPQVSLIAMDAADVVGHIFLSPVSIDGAPDGMRLMGLGPMAVAPARQRRGVGSRLVRAGLDACGALGTHAVVVLGHPRYYPRFGFAPAAALGLRCEYPVPDDVFMAMELVPGMLRGVSGVVQYHPEFAGM